jgi:hypothetical protein
MRFRYRGSGVASSREHRLYVILALAVGVVAASAGCGGGGNADGSADSAQTATTPRLLEAAGFPRPSNRSMRALLGNFRQGPVLAPSVPVLEPGRNRFGFGLFDRANRNIGELDVGLYVSRGLDESVRGPFPARYEPIEIEPRYRSKQTATDPDSATSIYVSDLRFPGAGTYLISAVTRLGNRLVATSPAQVTVMAHTGVPGSGDRAIRVHTPTSASVGGHLARIDTRIPPDSMHEVDLIDALDHHHPVLLLFATPALCQSRVCGPVTDIAEEVKAEYGDRVDFIHMEVYRDNDISRGYRPQLSAWHLRNEPYAFAIDRRGIVAERLEGAFSAGELRAAVRRALR